jgi:hypothetical protein
MSFIRWCVAVLNITLRRLVVMGQDLGPKIDHPDVDLTIFLCPQRNAVYCLK